MGLHQRRRLKDRHAVLLAVPDASPLRQARRKLGHKPRDDSGNVILALGPHPAEDGEHAVS
jgi:hypothetical protein